MEVLFENRFVRDLELAKELYKYYFFKRPLYIACDVICALSFLISMTAGILNKAPSYILLAFLPPLLVLFRVYMYRKSVTMLIKRDSEVNNDKLVEVQTIVTEANITLTATNGAVNELTYSKVKNAIQTKNLILLRSKANLIYIFRKDGFTKGTPEEFVLFLHGKGIKVK